MISDDSRSGVGPIFRDMAMHRGLPLQYFGADRLEVQPCTVCGSCSGKIYGRCVF